MDTTFVLEQVYNISPEQVWQALIDVNRMREWYFPQLMKFEPIVGFEFVFLDDGSTYQKKWQVTKVEDGRVLGHSWIYKEFPGISEVIFEVIKEADKTRLKLTHTGLDSFPNDAHFARHRFENGWKQILGSNLKNHLSKYGGY